VRAPADPLAADPPGGLSEPAPGFGSMLVSYDPAAISTADLVEHLQSLHDELRPERGITISSRLVHMPVAFDDTQSRAAVERYIHSIRKDAPNAEGGTNIDYVVRYTGLRAREELSQTGPRA